MTPQNRNDKKMQKPNDKKMTKINNQQPSEFAGKIFITLPSAACRTPKRVAKCGSCLPLGNPLRRWRVSDGQTCGVVKCETSLPAAAVCGDRAFRTPKHVVECEFLLGTGNPLHQRSDIQTCGKMQIWWGPAQPLRTKWGSTVKNWCKIVILKVQMQAWHESQTAITVGKLRFFNVRCQRSRICVELRLYPFWNVRHNRFARNKTCVKLRFYKGVFKVSARMRL